MATIPGWRVAFESVVRRAAPRERLLIVGTSPAAVSLATELTDRRYVLGLEIVGFVTGTALARGHRRRVLGDVSDIPAIVREHARRPGRRQPGERARNPADGPSCWR